MQESSVESLNIAFRDCLRRGDVAIAEVIIQKARNKRYPERLISAWNYRLAAHKKCMNPLDKTLNDETGSSASGEECAGQFGDGLRDELTSSMYKYCNQNFTIDPSRIPEIVDNIFASYDPIRKSVKLPNLTAKNPNLDTSLISESEYLDDNPDVSVAVEKGIVFSGIDHLLRNGFIEIMNGRRGSRKFYIWNNKRPMALTVVTDIASLPNSKIEELLSPIESFNDRCLLSVKGMHVLGNDRRQIPLSRFLYQQCAGVNNLAITLEGVTLRDASNKWISEVSLDTKNAIIGNQLKSGAPHYSLCASRLNALLGDITLGCIIAKPIDLLSIINDLSDYSTSAGFYHALILSLIEAGVTILHKNEFLSDASNANAELERASHSHWSPFHWSGCVDVDLSKSDIRQDYIMTWQKYLSVKPLIAQHWNCEGHSLSLCSHFRLTTDYHVGIIIPFKDKIHLLRECVRSIFGRKEGINIKVYAIDNGSTLAETFEEIASLQTIYSSNIEFVAAPGPFNYSKINNDAVMQVRESFLLFLNNDIIIESDNAISNLVQTHLFFNACATGAKLTYPSGRIQHNGLSICSLTHIAVTSPFKGQMNLISQEIPESSQIPTWSKTHECSAVTAACMLVNKDDFLAVGGFDVNLSIAYNDVDLCLVLKRRFKSQPVICCTDLNIVHLESESRGTDAEDPEKLAHLHKERAYLVNKHEDIFSRKDPFFPLDITRDNIYIELGSPKSSSFTSPSSKIDISNLYNSSGAIRDKTHSLAAIFVHYDKHNIISECTKYYMNELSKYVDLYFVSSAEGLANNKEDIEHISKFCRRVVIRRNSGYDFGCWSHIIRSSYSELVQYEGLLLCNDSVFGPLSDIGSLFLRLKLDSETSFWGLTASKTPLWHLQSYFILYSQKIVRNAIFKEHWFNIGAYQDKFDIIMAYEVGWSNLLSQLGFHGKALFDSQTASENPTHASWDKLISAGFPFIKKELIRDNPLRVNLESLPSILSKTSRPWAQDIKLYLDTYNKHNQIINEIVCASDTPPPQQAFVMPRLVDIVSAFKKIAKVAT